MGEHSAELEPVAAGGYWFVDPQRPDVERWFNGSQQTDLWRWRDTAVVSPVRQTADSWIVGLLAWSLAILSLGYLLPWAVAVSRGMPNAGGIFALNLLTGWTGIGWIIALVMACTQRRP